MLNYTSYEIQGHAGRGGPHEFNPEILTDSVLYPYLLNTGVGVFRCPDDLRQGAYQGTDPEKTGTVPLAPVPLM
jgi:hypothetical protein